MTATSFEARRSVWRGLIGFNLLTAIVLGIGGFFLGAWIGSAALLPFGRSLGEGPWPPPAPCALCTSV